MSAAPDFDPADPSTWPPTVLITSIGICAASLCTKETDEAAGTWLHREAMTGTWSVSDSPTFAGGEPNPHPCPDDPERRHVLFNC